MRIRINRYAVIGSLCVIFGLSRFTFSPSCETVFMGSNLERSSPCITSR